MNIIFLIFSLGFLKNINLDFHIIYFQVNREQFFFFA